MHNSFHRETFIYLPSAKFDRNAMFKQIVPSTSKTLAVRLFQSSRFKSLYEKKNEKLLS